MHTGHRMHTGRSRSTHTVLRRTVPQLSRRPFRAHRLRRRPQRRQAKSRSRNGKWDGTHNYKRGRTPPLERDGTLATESFALEQRTLATESYAVEQRIPAIESCAVGQNGT